MFLLKNCFFVIISLSSAQRLLDSESIITFGTHLDGVSQCFILSRKCQSACVKYPESQIYFAASLDGQLTCTMYNHSSDITTLKNKPTIKGSYSQIEFNSLCCLSVKLQACDMMQTQSLAKDTIKLLAFICCISSITSLLLLVIIIINCRKKSSVCKTKKTQRASQDSMTQTTLESNKFSLTKENRLYKTDGIQSINNISEVINSADNTAEYASYDAVHDNISVKLNQSHKFSRMKFFENNQKELYTMADEEWENEPIKHFEESTEQTNITSSSNSFVSKIPTPLSNPVENNNDYIQLPLITVNRSRRGFPILFDAYDSLSTETPSNLYDPYYNVLDRQKNHVNKNHLFAQQILATCLSAESI